MPGNADWIIGTSDDLPVPIGAHEAEDLLQLYVRQQCSRQRSQQRLAICLHCA